MKRLIIVGLLVLGCSNMSTAQETGPPYNSFRLPPDLHQPNKAIAMRSNLEIPKIDGFYDEIWEKVHIYHVGQLVYGQPSHMEDLIAGFQVAWSDERIFFYIRVIDDSLTTGDQVTIQIQGQPSIDIVWTGTNEKATCISQVVGLEFHSGPPPPKGAEQWYQQKGYTFEFSLPNFIDPDSNESMFKANIMVRDSDDGKSIESRWEWAEGIVQGNSKVRFMGEIQLKESFTLGTIDGFLPRQIWVEQDGLVVIEPELIDHHSNWIFKTDPERYTGTGYLEWQGPHLSLPPKPFLRRSNNDFSNERQGPQHHWLILRLKITTPGIYYLDLRNIHQFEDGDNDVWFGEVGQTFGLENPISRMGDNLKDGDGFTFLDWGVRELNLEAGLHTFCIEGRSVGFGIDRVVLYHKELVTPDEAKSFKTKPSKLIYSEN